MSNFDPRHHPRRPDGKFVERPTAAAPDPDLVADLADRPLPPDPLAATFTRTVTVDRTIHVPETGHDIDIPAGLEPVDDSVFVGDGRRGHGWTRVAWVVDDPDTDDPVLADEGAECWDVRHDRRHAEGLESACWNVAAYAESRGVDPGRVFPIRSSSRAEGTTWEVIDPDEDGRAHNADGLYVVPEDVDPDARAAYAAGLMDEDDGRWWSTAARNAPTATPTTCAPVQPRAATLPHRARRPKRRSRGSARPARTSAGRSGSHRRAVSVRRRRPAVEVCGSGSGFSKPAANPRPGPTGPTVTAFDFRRRCRWPPGGVGRRRSGGSARDEPSSGRRGPGTPLRWGRDARSSLPASG